MDIATDILAKTDGIPNFGAMVVVEGKIVFSHNPRTKLCACSSFKVAAATAVMRCVDQGVIDLDIPVTNYLPSLRFSDPASGQKVTLRMLLSHTSGLDDTEDVEDHPLETVPNLSFIADPERAFRYCNVGFDTALLITAHMVDCSYQELLHRNVLDPLGMVDTEWADSSPIGAPDSTTQDLIALCEEHLSGNTVLGDTSKSEMHRIHADSYTASPCRYYGLGIDVEEWDGKTLLSHGGGLGSNGSTMVLDPAENAAAVFLFDDPRGYGINAYEVLDRVLGRETRPKPIKGNNTKVEPYLGKYDNGATLSEEDGALLIEWKGEKTPLEPVDDRLFKTNTGVSLGLLPGDPKMISFNGFFLLIGAIPGRLVDSGRSVA